MLTLESVVRQAHMFDVVEMRFFDLINPVKCKPGQSSYFLRNYRVSNSKFT